MSLVNPCGLLSFQGMHKQATTTSSAPKAPTPAPSVETAGPIASSAPSSSGSFSAVC